jgi:hypothetical protein
LTDTDGCRSSALEKTNTRVFRIIFTLLERPRILFSQECLAAVLAKAERWLR